MFHDSVELDVGPVRSEWTFDILTLTSGSIPHEGGPAALRSFEQRMDHVGLGDLHLGAKDVLWLVGILFAAFVASDRNLIGQHGQGGEGIGFAKNDAMLVGRVVLVVKSVILTDDNPEVVGRVLHR